MKLTPFRVAPKAFHELIIMPQFGDVLDSETGTVTVPSDEEGDWMIMDEVYEQGRPILDLFGGQNVLKRRDATCKLIYSPVGRLGARNIYGTKLYAATEDCQEEFYQGAFSDYEQENFDIFGENVMPILEKGVATDIYSNKWFGDVSRPSDINGIWSWNKFNGVFTHIARYIATGVIPSEQIFAIPEGDLTPTQAKDALASAFSKQDGTMKFFDKTLKVFYVDEDLAEAYHDYIVQSGQTVMADRMSGKPILFYKGIRVKPKKWDGILAALNGGTAAHAVILTLQGNFLYGANSKYGGGPKRNEAVRIWWSDDDNVWKRQMHMMAGTELAAPQFITFGLTSF
jgi:hypothetical protein